MRAVIVSNPRNTGGSQSRADGWTALLTSAGYDVETLDVRFDRRRPWRAVHQVVDIVRGTVVPETLIWQPQTLLADLRRREPDVVVFQTLRVFSPRLVALETPMILDFVDQLSSSYARRARHASGWRTVAFRALASAHRRTEQRVLPSSVVTAAAGVADAKALDCEWIPLLAPDAPDRAVDAYSAEPQFDATFFGSLNYPPNVEALEWLARAPGVERLSVLVAGRGATSAVRSLCDAMSWTLAEDFRDVEWLAERASVAVAPLLTTNGIQCKILDSAAVGMPQVTTSAALRGFGPGFPTSVADDGAAFVAAVARLVEHEDEWNALARRARAHVKEHYGVEAWVGPVVDLIGRASNPETVDQANRNDGSTWWPSTSTPSIRKSAGANSIESTGSADRAA